MNTILVDDNGDRVTKNGLFVYLYDLDAVTQTCEQAIKQQLRELQYDQKKGVEYFNNVFTGSPNLQLFESQARRQILNIDGVIGISSFAYEAVDDELSYTATIKTRFGNGVINGGV